MKAFAELFARLDETTKTKEKVAALMAYFANANPADAAWCLFFLTGRRLPQPVPIKRLKEWTTELAALPEWLFAECYQAVGDLAETITLLLPPASTRMALSLQQWVEQVLLPLRQQAAAEQKRAVLNAWDNMDNRQRFVANKLMTGQFRVGVSQLLIIQALAQLTQLDRAIIAHRLMGHWQPTADFWQQLISPLASEVIASQPYPFCLANPLLDEVASLGDMGNWQAEWKWDGIRAQLIVRHGEVYLWSRGEELITDQFPELALAAKHLPDGVVLDGEILPWQKDRISTFSLLQRRLGRKQLSKRLLEEIPVVILVYDLLEYAGNDMRTEPLSWRRQQLQSVFNTLTEQTILQLSPIVKANDWQQLVLLRQQSREQLAEGLMLKRHDSAYLTGRQKGAWWKWKIDPYTVDAVLIAAQQGHGRRAGLYTDYTFAIWSENNELVPFAKAYSGLTDAEIRQVDAFVRRNTLQKFGPVRAVKAELVFEIAFENILLSKRHKSGVAVRFPRILRWRLDKTIEQADNLQTLRSLIR